MKIIFRTALLLTLACAMSSAKGEDVKRYQVNVGDFSELRVNNNIAVDYHCNPDSAGIALLFTTDRQADWILFDNNSKGRLTVMSDVDYPAGETLPRVIVYSSELTKVVNSGDSLVKVFETTPAAVETDKFKATLIGNGRLVVHNLNASKVSGSIDSGNGQLVLSGRCDEASLRNVGTGTIQADALESERVKATVLGTGDIGCDPKQRITVMGLGSGTVYYRVTPPEVKSRGIGVKHGTF